MSSKAILKKTREAIDAKDFVEALKLSKSVLKDDKNNYVALVYSGVASQEAGLKEDAETYYEKAIRSMPGNVLAWQGLANCYDKWIDTGNTDTALIQKVLKVYRKLIELDKDDNKVLKILNKIERPQILLLFNEVIEILTHFLSLEISETMKENIKGIILKLLSDQGVSENCQSLFESCYSASDNPTEKEHLQYLKVLSAQGKFEDLFNCLKTLGDKYPMILNWQCQKFIEFYILNDNKLEVLMDILKTHEEALKNSDSKYSVLTAIIFDILNDSGNGSIEIKDALENIVGQHQAFLHAWILLCECYMTLQFDQEAIQAVQNAKKLVLATKALKYEKKIDLLTCLTFSRSHKREELLKSLEIGTLIINEGDKNIEILESLVRTNLQLKNLKAAEDILESFNKTLPIYHILKALVCQEQGNILESVNILEGNIQDTSEYWLLLGDLYWREQTNKSLVAYLKATKANPSLFICYERLGRYYQKSGELDKARRCYEKSFKLKSSKDACIALSKIYRKLQKWDENLSLLLTLTSRNITLETAWAFFQLGIHYYEREDFNNALTTLRLVIRLEPDNGFCWECLGDCYFSGGSYISALKCYQKVKEINPNLHYPMLQIANIKKLLGEFVDAQHEFESLLQVNENYLPALKGVAETCYLIAKQYYNKQLYGLARDALQLSLNYISRALHIKSSLSCCWKIAADCCYMTSILPFKYAFLSVTEIVNDSQQDGCLVSDELLMYAIQLYCKALSLNSKNIYLYHDLACSYMQYAKLVMDAAKQEDFLKHALIMIQHCVSNNGGYAEHWNVLGNILFQTRDKRLGMSQHAFIKALTCDRNSAISWTNLGAVYLHLDELKLANDVFSQAQKSNPNYVNCWIGQALIAEASKMDEAMDLFRHTMELAYHPEGSIGYAHWVCKTLITKRRDEVIYEIDNMHAISVACDGLRWYVENNPRDACSWNMLGILSERLGLLKYASLAYTIATKYSDQSEALTNQARTLYSCGDFEAAKWFYEQISSRNVNSDIGYALTLFKAEDYEAAYRIYENVLNGDLDGKNIQSDLLVALASMNYMFGGPEPTKHLLFQSTELETRSPWSLYAVLSLGLLHDDLNLAALTLQEIKNQVVNEENLHHYANLLIYTYLIQGDYQTAIAQISSLIHKYPASSTLWLALSSLLYRVRDAKQMNSVIVKCAQASLVLKGNNPNLSMVLPMVAATSILSGDMRNALRTAQRQVHYYPNDESYQILRVCIKANC